MNRKKFVLASISLTTLILPLLAMAFRVSPQEEAAVEKAWGFEVDLSVFLVVIISVFTAYLAYRLIRKYIFNKTLATSWLADLSIIFGLTSVLSLPGRIGLVVLQLFSVTPIGQIGPNCLLLLPIFGTIAAVIAILFGVADRIKEKQSRIGISARLFHDCCLFPSTDFSRFAERYFYSFSLLEKLYAKFRSCRIVY